MTLSQSSNKMGLLFKRTKKNDDGAIVSKMEDLLRDDDSNRTRTTTETGDDDDSFLSDFEPGYCQSILRRPYIPTREREKKTCRFIDEALDLHLVTHRWTRPRTPAGERSKLYYSKTEIASFRRRAEIEDALEDADEAFARGEISLDEDETDCGNEDVGIVVDDEDSKKARVRFADAPSLVQEVIAIEPAFLETRTQRRDLFYSRDDVHQFRREVTLDVLVRRFISPSCPSISSADDQLGLDSPLLRRVLFDGRSSVDEEVMLESLLRMAVDGSKETKESCACRVKKFLENGGGDVVVSSIVAARSA